MSEVPIPGAEHLTVGELRQELRLGGRFVRYDYCVSVIILTFRLRSGAYYLPPGGSAAQQGLKYSAISLLAGWWGIPFGPIFTIISVLGNFKGKDITHEIVDQYSRYGINLEPTLQMSPG